MNNLLTISFAKEYYLNKIFEHPPLTSISQQIESNVLGINLLELPSSSTCKNKSNYHSILIGHRQLEAEIEIGDLSQVGKFNSNNSLIIPANCQNSSSWEGSAKCIILSLEPELLDRSYYESTSLYLPKLLPSLPKFDGIFYEIGSKFQLHMEHGKSLSQNYVDSLSSMLINHLIEFYCPDITDSIIIQPFSKNDLKLINKYILDISNPNSGIKELAKLFDITLPYFGKRLKAATGFSPHQYLNKIKFQKAKKCLATTNKTISEVATICNFGSVDTLRRLIRKEEEQP